MRRILIVADGLLGGAELRERLALKKSTDPQLALFVLVPERGASSGAGAGAPAKSADRILELELAVLRDLQYEVSGAVGGADPVAAVRSLVASRPFDEIMLLALPAGASRFFHLDLAHRLQRATKLPVEEIAGEEPDAAEEARLAALQFPGVPAAAEAGDPVRVLLVEDDESDVELTKLALERCKTPNTMETVGDGAQAIKWLTAAGGPAGVDLVLVDLKMPVMDGFELLERLRSEHDLEQLAVVVLTTSGRIEDRERAHSLGAHAYVTKDASFPLYRDLLEGLLAEVAR